MGPMVELLKTLQRVVLVGRAVQPVAMDLMAPVAVVVVSYRMLLQLVAMVVMA